MSTDVTRAPTRGDRSKRRRSRAFVRAFAIVVGALAVIALGGAALTVVQGPRVTDVQLDADAAIAASGSRVIFTTTQALTEVTPEQVTVSPAADFTVDTSGRSVGVRFALPLWDDTDYTIRIDGVTGTGGGPASVLEESFRTPELSFSLLQRSGGEDAIFRADLAGSGQPVFTHPHIEDFRATGSHLVVSTVDDEGGAHLIVTDLAGGDERELPLPGDGFVTNLQSADRGEVIGYTFTDADLGAAGGIESALYVSSLRGGDPEPQPIAIEGADARVGEWRFVPGTDSLLMLTFDGALNLVSAGGGDPVALGTAIAIDGIARGSSQAIVQRADGARVIIDLATAEEHPLPETDPAAGQVGAVTPLPGASGATLRVLSQVDGFTLLSTDLAVVDAEGAARVVASVPPTDTLLQTCVSPSGRYAAMLVAPDAVDNPYDGYLLPLPERIETRVVAVADGAEVVALDGFDISWCQDGPPL